ncbi:MAG TPA: hypothetical protein VNZ58_02255 [Thermomicrobiales bacterium]|nr:hypothetical protein [Thermomicrobiales bacterium]
MSTPFDRFLGEMTSGMGVNTGTQPVDPRPWSPGAASSSPTPSIQTMPQDFMALIQQAISQVQPVQAPPPQAVNPAAIQQGFQRPNPALASTQPMSGGGAQSFQQDEPEITEPWVMVEYQSADGPTWFYIPESKLFEAPDGVRVREDTRTDDPARIGAARANGYTYDQQSPDVQSAFRTAQEVSDARYQKSQNPQDVPVGPLPDTPSTTASLTPEQEAQRRQALGMTDDEEAQHFVVADLKAQAEASGDTELLQTLAVLEENGITDFNSTDILMQNPSTGKLMAVSPEQTVTDPATGETTLASAHETNEPVGTPLPALTTDDLRKTNPAAANDLEKAGVFMIRQGQMAIRLPNGMVMVVNDVYDVPEGGEVLAYGGKSEERADRRLIDGPGDILKPLPIVASGIKDAVINTAVGGLELASNIYDKPRQWKTGENGEAAYQWAISDDPNPFQSPQGLGYNTGGFSPDGEGGLERESSPGFEAWVNDNRELVASLYENGYTDPKTGRTFEGGQAVWERYSADAPLYQRIAESIVEDPLNTLAAASSVTRGAARGVAGSAGDVSRGAMALSRGLSGAARVLDLPDELIGKPIAAIPGVLGKGVAALPRDIPLGRGRWNPVTKTMEYPKVLPGPGRLVDLADPASVAVNRAQQTLRDVMKMGPEQVPAGQQGLGPAPAPQNPAAAPPKPGGAGPTHGQIIEEPALPMEVRPDAGSKKNRGKSPLRVTPQEAQGLIPDSIPDGRMAALPDADGIYPDLTPDQMQQMSVAEISRYEAIKNGSIPPEPMTVPVPESATLTGGTATSPERALNNEGPFPDWQAPERLTDRGNTPLRPTPETAQGNAPDPVRRMIERQQAEQVSLQSQESAVRNLSPGEQLERRRAEMAERGNPITGEPQQVIQESSLGRAIDADSYPEWGFAAPREGEEAVQGQRRIVDKAYDLRSEHPDRWEAFRDLHDGNARDFVTRQGDVDPRNLSWSDKQLRAVDEANYIIHNLIPDYNEAFAGVSRVEPNDFRPKYRNGSVSKAFDDELIETAIFGDGRASASARNQLSGRANMQARRKGDDTLKALMPEIDDLRRSYLSQVEDTTQKTLADAMQAGVKSGTTDMVIRDLPMNKVRAVRDLTPEQRADLGIPDFQMREADFAEQSVKDIVDNFDPNQFDPIKVVEGKDGNFYVTSGHSRREAFRRMGRETIPAHIQSGDIGSITRTAKLSNTAGTALDPINQGRVARELTAQGDTLDQVASSMKIKKSEVNRYIDASYIPQGPLYDAVVGQQVRLDMASSLGNAVRKDIMSPQEVNDFFVRVVLPERLTAADVRAEVIAHAQMKAKSGLTQDAFGSTGFWESRREMASVRKELRKERTKLNRWKNVAKESRLSREQVRLRQEAQSNVDALEKRLADMTEAQYVPLDSPASIGDDILRPNAPEGTPAPGETIPSADRSAADVMRDSGARGLFDMGIINDPRRQAEALHDATVGWLRERVANPYASPAPSRIVTDDAGSVYSLRGRRPSKMLRDVLDTTLDGGETLGQRWERRANELETFGRRDDAGKITNTKPFTAAEAEQDAAAEVLDDLAIRILKEKKPRQYQRYADEYARLSKTPRGEDRIEAVRRTKALAKSYGKNVPLGVYDGALSVLREMALYGTYTGWRYILTQAVGNSITLMLTGHGDVVLDSLRPRNYRGALAEIRAGENTAVSSIAGLASEKGVTGADGKTMLRALDEIGELPAALMHDAADDVLAELGLAGTRADLGRLVKDQISTVQRETASQGMRAREVADNLRLGRMKLPKMGWATSPLANRHIRDWANAFDLTARKTLYADQMQKGVAAMRGDLYQHMLARKPANITEDSFNAVWERLPNTFGADRVRETFASLDAGWAERMARDWQNSILHLDETARKEVRRVMFSGEETNADAILRRTIFFHYWMSRAVPLYTASVAKHPGMMNAYFNAMSALERDTQDDSPSVRGLLKVMNSWLGWNIYIRPDAMFQLFNIVGDGSAFNPDNESPVGRFMRSTGLFWNPVVASVANYAGLMGDTFAPDPLMMGQWTSLVQLGVDAMKDAGWVPDRTPTGNFYTDINARARETISGWTDGFLPGASRIFANDATGFPRRDLNFLIQDVAEERGLDPNGPEAQAAMDDPESDLYQEAFHRFVMGRGAVSLARVFPTSLFYPKAGVARADEVSKAIRTATGDERQALYNQRDIANTGDPMARRLKTEANGYYDVGTDFERNAYRTYNQIRYGDLDGSVDIGGISRNERALSQFDEDDRKALADQWAAESRSTEAIQSLRDKRQAFREAHPAWDAYLTWSQQVRDYDGGPWVYWRDMSEGNPNAARWLDGQNEFVSLDEIDRQLTGVEAYMAFSGVQPTVFDAKPTATNTPTPPTPYNPAATQGSGGSSSSQKKSPESRIASALESYRTAMDEYNAAVTNYYGYPVDMDNINPMAANAYAAHLLDAGITRPPLSNEAQSYLKWVAAQPPGSDTSIMAFVKWAGLK